MYFITSDNVLDISLYYDTKTSIYDKRNWTYDYHLHSGHYKVWDTIVGGYFAMGTRYSGSTLHYENSDTIRDYWKNKMIDYYYNYFEGTCGGIFTLKRLNVGGSSLDEKDGISFSALDQNYPSYRWTRVTSEFSRPSIYMSDASYEYFCLSWIKAQIQAYKDILVDIDNAIAEDTTLIDKYENNMTQWQNSMNEFNDNYTNFLRNYDDLYADKYLVFADNPTGNVKNDVTNNLYQRRNGQPAIDGMAHPYVIRLLHIGSDNSAKWAYSNVFTGKLSAYSNYDVSSEIFEKYSINGDLVPLKPVLDTTYESMANKLDFKYRVVKTDSVNKVMTTTEIKNNGYKSGECMVSLSYKEVLEKPYSYGIIMNSFLPKKTDTTIHEWEYSKRMRDTPLDDSSLWLWSNPTPSFTLVDTDEDTKVTWWSGQNGSLDWVTSKKKGKDSPSLSGDISLSGRFVGMLDTTDTAPTDWSFGNFTDKYEYDITGTWIDKSGTMKIVTEQITAKSHKNSDNNVEVVRDVDDSYYNPETSGSYFKLWRNNGEISFSPVFPMMVSTTSEDAIGNNPYPTEEIDNADGNGHRFRTLTSPGLGYKNGFWTEWFNSNQTDTVKTPYEVNISYKSKSKITTTFSTDNEDVGTMGSDSIPFIKAGQAFSVDVSDNVLVIDAYCNVPYSDSFVKNNTGFSSADDFANYIGGIAEQLSNCPVEVLSTVEGLNVSSNGGTVDNNGTNPDLAKNLSAQYTEATGVDDTEGINFKSGSNTYNYNRSDVNLYSNQYFIPYGNRYYFGVGASGPISESVLSEKTQTAYNYILAHGQGEDGWYYEYS